MSVLSVLRLQRHHTLQIRRLMLVHVAVVVRQELHDLPLLKDGQNVQQGGGVLSEPGQGKQACNGMNNMTFERERQFFLIMIITH